MKKTLNEVINEVGLTRRQIQECEKYGLENDRDSSENHLRNKHHKPFTIQPTKENGKLMYDEDAVERLWLIKFYKELDYKHDDISKIFNDPDYDKEKSLNEAIEQLEAKKNRIDSLIAIAKNYKLNGRPVWNNKFLGVSSFDSLLNNLNFIKDNQILSGILDKYLHQFVQSFESVIIPEDFGEYINECSENNIPFDDEKVLHHISDLYKSNEKACKYSITYFCIGIYLSIIILSLLPGDKYDKGTDLEKLDDYLIYFVKTIYAFYIHSNTMAFRLFYTIYNNYCFERPSSEESNIVCMQIINEILKEKFEAVNFNELIDFLQLCVQNMRTKDVLNRDQIELLNFFNYMKEINKIS